MSLFIFLLIIVFAGIGYHQRKLDTMETTKVNSPEVQEKTILLDPTSNSKSVATLPRKKTSCFGAIYWTHKCISRNPYKDDH